MAVAPPILLCMIDLVVLFGWLIRIHHAKCPPENRSDCQHLVQAGDCLSERFSDMLSSCATSCGFCKMLSKTEKRLKVAQYPSQKWAPPCKDVHTPPEQCVARAAEGLCVSFPDFMLHNCAASCKTCGRGPGLDCDSRRPLCRSFLAGLLQRRIACGEGAVCRATMDRARLMHGWSKILSALNQTFVELSQDSTNSSARVDPASEQDCRDALDGMRSVLHSFVSDFEESSEDRRLLAFYFPRAAVREDLNTILESSFGLLPRGGPVRAFFDLVSEVVTRVWQMALTDEEKWSFSKWKQMELAESSKRAAAEEVDLSEDRSFGSALHLKDANDPEESVEVMEDWELPWMYQLVDRAVARSYSECQHELGECRGTLRILEVGWGQGISGRRLIETARKYGVRVEYTVIEPHPAVIKNARAVAAAQFPGVPFQVLEGTWQEIMPDLLAHSFDCVVADFFETLNGELSGEGWSHHRFFVIAVYRLLSVGGAFAWFDGSFNADPEMFTEQTRFYMRLFSNFELSYVNRLKPTDNKYYTFTDAMVPVGIK